MVLMSSGSADIFIQKLDTYGNLIWVKQIGGTGSDVGRFITINYLGALYATGYFYGTADFDPGGGNSSLTSAGSSDIFILKLDTNGNFIWVNQMGATGSDVGYSILANTSGDVYSTGYFRGTVDFNTGAGTANLTSSGFSSIDIYVQKLGPCVSSSATINISACDSFVSPSGNYVWTSSNTYMDTIPNNDGCDSAITLNLIINNSNTGDTTAVVCDSFTWYGITYTSSDSPTHIFTNAAGCDSVVTLKLTINAVDTSVTQVAFTFTSNASGAGYRWLDCAAGYSIIINETNQSFTATANGSYAVEVTENGCVDTSACHAVNNIGIMENNFINKMTIYPNPFTEKFSIDLGGTYQNISLVITDINGQTIKALTLDRSNLLNMTMEAPPGIYIVKIISGNMHVVFKLVKI